MGKGRKTFQYSKPGILKYCLCLETSLEENFNLWHLEEAVVLPQ